MINDIELTDASKVNATENLVAITGNTYPVKEQHMKTNPSLIDRIEEVLVCRNGMSRSSVVTRAFAVCIFGAHCTELVNCEDDRELANHVTSKMVSEAASVIIGEAKNYFAGRVDVIAM